MDDVLAKIDMEDMLVILSPKEQDTIRMWLSNSYSLAEIAHIIKHRYNDYPTINHKAIGSRIKLIIVKLRKNAPENLKKDL